MKILKMKVKWNEGFANSPELQVLVDKIPEDKELRYKNNGLLYFAEKGGYVRFLARDANEPGRGYGGREFKLMMESGLVATLRGPWSSRSAVMNANGFKPCMEALITDDPDKYERGQFRSGNITMDKIHEYWDALENLGKQVFLVEVHNGNEYTLIPSADEDVVMKPSEKEEEFEGSNFDGISQVQSDVLKSKLPEQEVICNKADECRFEGCEHKKKHIVGYISDCCTEEEVCTEAPQFGKTKCIPYVEGVDVLENFLQRYHEGIDIDDLSLRKMMTKEMQYNAIVKWMLGFLDCPVKSMHKPNSDPPNRVVYDDDELKVMVIEIEKILKILEGS